MNDHEISGTKFHNFHSSKFERSIQRVSIERFHLTYIYLTRPIHLVDGMALEKKTNSSPPPGSRLMPITRNEQLPRVHTCSLTDESEGGEDRPIFDYA